MTTALPGAVEVASIREVLAGGFPVILVTGGPLVLDHDAEVDPTAGARLRASLARTPAVPRHYVLALPWQIIEQDTPVREACTSTSPPADPCAPST